jgi:hypothetical protein
MQDSATGHRQVQNIRFPPQAELTDPGNEKKQAAPAQEAACF